jgi:hypothetical protein
LAELETPQMLTSATLSASPNVEIPKKVAENARYSAQETRADYRS